jgi:hypothetical protein
MVNAQRGPAVGVEEGEEELMAGYLHPCARGGFIEDWAILADEHHRSGHVTIAVVVSLFAATSASLSTSSITPWAKRAVLL